MSEYDLYDEWINAKIALNKFKMLEIKLRNELINKLTKQSDYGTNKTLKIEDGNYKIKIGLGLSKSIDIAELNGIWRKLSDLEKESIVWKPSVVNKNYNILEKENPESKIFNCITEKQKQSTLTIEINDE